MNEEFLRLLPSVRLTEAEVSEAFAEVESEDCVGRSDAVAALGQRLRATRAPFWPPIPGLS
ncbi:hypothetical protein OHS18_34475 [Amycolatopsis sp. NBC_00355]|uniref:hypothetical protein n=1 Tax=Amycolatopsis sp. NBC_00355 TaxID=2975957 RepID=UPI002E25BBDD